MRCSTGRACGRLFNSLQFYDSFEELFHVPRCAWSRGAHKIMSFSEFSPSRVLGLRPALARHGIWRLSAVAAFHIAAFAVLIATEVNLRGALIFLATWGFLNFFWLALVRRPGIASGLSLAIVIVLVLLSHLKHDVMLLTANFVDLMVVDTDSVRFLYMIYPNLGWLTALGVALGAAAITLVASLDPFVIRRRVAAGGMALSLAGIVLPALQSPMARWEAFYGDSYVSKFSRSGVSAIDAFARDGYLDANWQGGGDAYGALLDPAREAGCVAHGKRPHIILIHDESSYDITAIPGIRVPKNYQSHFRSFDGRARRLLVEGNGGPSWYTEYNVLAGLSSRSFGHFSYFVTKISNGRVERGLPNALKRCGYRTHSFYPAYGAFMSARGFQTTMGIEHFRDARDLGTRSIEPDSFYYDAALKTLNEAAADTPLFMYVYLAANHFPWDRTFRPELTPDWKDPGNTPVVDEYLRRQELSARQYRQFVSRLRRDFPDEAFLIVRYGDHQPEFTPQLIEPNLDDKALAARMSAYDPRYFTTYYAIDAIRFRPVNLTSALPELDAPYLPLVVQEAAGLSLPPSFAEQKRILVRCRGHFFSCGEGEEARRLNRLLIEAGLIKGL